MARRVPVWAFTSFLVLSTAVVAAADAPGGEMVERTVVISTVDRIDLSTHEVTLKGVDGRRETLALGPEARNLGQLKVGDVVTITYSRTVAIVLAAPEGNPSAAGATDVQRAPLGAKPGGKVTNVDEVTAVVEGVDRAHRMVTIRGPGGNVNTVTVGDEVDLGRIRMGDRVIARYTDAVAISVAQP